MINLDRFDYKIINTLKKHNSLNKHNLWLKSNTKEGQKTFNERVIKLKEYNVINIQRIKINGILTHSIKLTDDNIK